MPHPFKVTIPNTGSGRLVCGGSVAEVNVDYGVGSWGKGRNVDPGYGSAGGGSIRLQFMGKFGGAVVLGKEDVYARGCPHVASVACVF